MEELLRGQHRVLLAVLHVSEDQYDVVEQAGIALSAGADGVFLCAWPASVGFMRNSISAVITWVSLTYTQVRSAFPECYLGVNFMADPKDLTGPINAHAVWFDEGVDGNGASERLTSMLAKLDELQFEGLRFGGFAFKGKKYIPDEQLMELGAVARELLTVPTTSGAGTGVAMDAGRAALVREALGPDTVVAVASGVTAQNVHEYLPFFNCFVVGTGIEAEKPVPLAESSQASEGWAEMQQLVREGDGPECALRLTRKELELQLCTIQMLSIQSNVSSEGAISVWLDGTEGMDKINNAMWERTRSRYEQAYSTEQLQRDRLDHLRGLEETVGAAGLVVQGQLDGSKVRELADLIHAYTP